MTKEQLDIIREVISLINPTNNQVGFYFLSQRRVDYATKKLMELLTNG